MAETHAILPYTVEPLDPAFQALEHFLMNDDADHDFPINTPPNILDQPPVEGSEFVHLRVDPIIEEGFQTNDKPSDFGNPINLSSWPLKVPPYTCSCCQILREITHTNGIEITKLEIHGRLGMICHAVLDKYCVDPTPNHEHKMFDFCKESIGRVKQFLVEYCMERKQNAYIMLQDPLSSFYEAVCVGFDWEESKVVHDDHVRKDSGDHHMNQLPNGDSSRSARSVSKNTLSIQRDRTRKLTIRDFVDYFHLPLKVAGKKIQACPTVIKKICRKHGLSRWPSRQIKSAQRKISTKTRKLTSMEAEERGLAQAEIDRLQQEISDIYSRYQGSINV